MRDTLPKRMLKEECAVVNLGDQFTEGTHWVSYKRKKNQIFYFDSFGLVPPKNLINYWGKNVEVYYNSERIQEFGSFVCGHLCLKFLKESA